MGAVALRGVRWRLFWLCLAIPFPAAAHVETAQSPSPEPLMVFFLILSIGLYVLGLLRLRDKTQAGPTFLRQAAAFLMGWLMLAIALLSPIDTLGVQLFSVHMVQHEIMMIAAAPLLVLGRPFGIWLWALPEAWRKPVVDTARSSIFRYPWATLSHPLAAWLFHAAALWLWHVPQFFQAALANNTVHIWQHLSFLMSALFFWWAVLGAAGRGTALVCLFTTMIHTGALGALLAFSATPWFPAYAATTTAFGITPLEDQQLGGLIMWVPGGMIYVAAALGLMARHFGLFGAHADKSAVV